MKRILALGAFITAPILGAGCGANDDLADEGTASAVVAITSVPTGVQCVSITATGSRAVTSTFTVMTGQAATLSMQGLPTGSVTFTGNAFAATCPAVLPSDVPTFVGVPTVAQLSTASVTQVTLPMAKNGRASVTVDFEGDSAMCGNVGQVCTAATPCCTGLTCTVDPTLPSGGSTCQASPMCTAAGQSCTSATQCCSGLSCTVDPTLPSGGSTCKASTMCTASGQTCTATTQCCTGLACSTQPGFPNPTCHM